MKRFEKVLVGVDGGPCPSCGESGLLLADQGVYGQQRTLTHTAAGAGVRACVVPMSAGRVVITSDDGVWSFEVHDG